MVELWYKGVKVQDIASTLEISGIVLAGGKGIRLGQNKILETIGNRSLLERVISKISQLCREIIVVTSTEQTIPQSISSPGLKIVPDISPGKGPLVGIYTGLKASNYWYNLVVACDMPFLNQALLRYMIQLATNYGMVVPRLDNLVEPLHAVYSKDCLAAIEDMIKLNELSVNKLMGLVRVRYVEADEIDRLDPQHLSFFNINTKADLEKARKLAGND